jgi:hypothetical protein
MNHAINRMIRVWHSSHTHEQVKACRTDADGTTVILPNNNHTVRRPSCIGQSCNLQRLHVLSMQLDQLCGRLPVHEP